MCLISLKLIISVRDGTCDYLSQVSKSLGMPLVCTVASSDQELFIGVARHKVQQAVATG
jgi:hypothetical protein